MLDLQELLTVPWSGEQAQKFINVLNDEVSDTTEVAQGEGAPIQ